jgi:hypothetical protein
MKWLAEPNSAASQFISGVAPTFVPATSGVALRARGYTWTITGLRILA